MIELSADILKDIENVNNISIVPTMLEVICRSTGMGFSAIARVTDEKWIACSVRDEINFGLTPGGELQLETTICNEIRQSRQGVVIDHVAIDPLFNQHHTPKMYGFQSYISIPIILNNGKFFGTLCAIDPRPSVVSDVKIVGMFTLFAQLIAFHLNALDVVGESLVSLKDVTEQLAGSQQETRRYEHITYHSLREPVRKISLFSDILCQETDNKDWEKTTRAAEDIRRFSQQLAGIIKQLDNTTNSL